MIPLTVSIYILMIIFLSPVAYFDHTVRIFAGIVSVQQEDFYFEKDCQQVALARARGLRKASNETLGTRN